MKRQSSMTIQILLVLLVLGCVSCGNPGTQPTSGRSTMRFNSSETSSSGQIASTDGLTASGQETQSSSHAVIPTSGSPASSSGRTTTSHAGSGGTNTSNSQQGESKEAVLNRMMAALRADCEKYNVTNEMLVRSLKAEGNRIKIANAMRKAMRGETVTVGVIGGSVTEGTGASSEQNRYANQIMEWWREAFPKSDIRFVNAGIGSSDSVLGVHRIQENLLFKNPDFVVVEYAVNDKPDERTDPIQKEAYENLVRRLLKVPSSPGVLLLFMVNSSGTSAQGAQSQIGAHYNLPMISYHNAVWPEVSNGRFSWRYLSGDTVHPTDIGHGIAAVLVKNYLIDVFRDLESIGKAAPATPNPLISDRFEKAAILDVGDITPKSLGSFSMMSASHRFWTGWTANGSGQPMVLELPACRNVFLLLQMNVSGKTAMVSINQGTEQSVSNNAGSTYAWESVLLYSGNQDEKVTIRITPQGSFTVLGVMIS